MFEKSKKRARFLAFHETRFAKDLNEWVKNPVKKTLFYQLVRYAGYASEEALATYYTHFNQDSHPLTTASDFFDQQEELTMMALGFQTIQPLLTLRAAHPKTLTQQNRDYVFISLASTTWDILTDQREERKAIAALKLEDSMKRLYRLFDRQKENIQAGLEIAGFQRVRTLFDVPQPQAFAVAAQLEETAFIGAPIIYSDPKEIHELWSVVAKGECKLCAQEHYIRTEAETIQEKIFSHQIQKHFLLADEMLARKLAHIDSSDTSENN